MGDKNVGWPFIVDMANTHIGVVADLELGKQDR
jgi:hypothetical protein